MTVEAIKQAITELEADERESLAGWFDELQEKSRDLQFEKDFSPGGRASSLISGITLEIEMGELSSLEDGLALRRKRLQNS